MGFDGFRVSAVFESPINPRRDGACLCLQTGEEECYIVGTGCSVSLTSADPEKPHLDLLLLEEGTFEEGSWKPGRRLNGDEAAQIALNQPKVLHARFFTYA